MDPSSGAASIVVIIDRIEGGEIPIPKVKRSESREGSHFRCDAQNDYIRYSFPLPVGGSCRRGCIWDSMLGNSQAYEYEGCDQEDPAIYEVNVCNKNIARVEALEIFPLA